MIWVRRTDWTNIERYTHIWDSKDWQINKSVDHKFYLYDNNSDYCMGTFDTLKKAKAKAKSYELNAKYQKGIHE